jgi:hypothetical protein
MTPLLQVCLAFYLAAMLGVSGLTNIDDPGYFEYTLRRQRILPACGIPLTARIVPWLEVAVAVALIGGLAPVLTAVVALLLFTTFFVIETILVATRRATECGCFGVAYPQKVDGASLVVSTILVALSALHLWSAASAPSLGIEWRLAALVVGGGTGVWIVSRMIKRHRPPIIRVKREEVQSDSEHTPQKSLISNL